MVVTATALALLVAACGGGGGESSGGSGQGGGQIDRESTLRMAWTVPAPTLDPHKPQSPTAQFPYVFPVYDRLTQMTSGEGGPELAPMLATVWTFAPDGLSATFTLRDGVVFQDGTPLDAAAVKASLDRARTLPESTVKGQFSIISEVTAVAPNTVRITTTRPAADLPYILSMGGGSIISPAALTNPDLDVAPVGSGPYRAVSVRLGDGVTYERNPGYWDPEAQKSARIEMTGITNDNARLSALRSGQVDLILTKIGQYDQASKLGDDFGYYSYTETAAQTYSLLLNTARPGVDQVKVRQALNFAIDRDALNQGILSDQCRSIAQPISTYYPGHLEDPPIAYTHDPARARQLLAEAGLPGGLDLKVAVASGLSPQDRLASAVQAQLAEVGVRVQLDAQDSVQLASQWNVGAPWDGWMHVRTASPTPAMTLRDNFLTPNRFPGPQVPALQEAVNAAFDPNLSPEQIDTTLQDASRVIVDQALDVEICTVPTQFAYSNRVVGVDGMGQAGYTGIFDLRYVGLTAAA
ncbi:ABC transporter substrate-binding protein [Pseudonocardia pini]|uniref:ABC transporter substrate-binding protein n=1 Tax=Pseudonocardia pini TaxID=2758030 RepID=UPI0015F02D2F|nr:ABC transporter substrate-binding protein [Pseudonocardia pini]